MPSRIPHSGVPLADLVKGRITREWFRFFEGLWNLTGAGGNNLSLSDLALGGAAPVVTQPYEAFTVVGNVYALLNFPNTAAGACSNLVITVPGAVITDIPIVAVPAVSVPANGGYTWYMNNGSVTIRYTNNDPAVAYDPGLGGFRVLVLRA